MKVFTWYGELDVIDGVVIDYIIYTKEVEELAKIWIDRIDLGLKNDCSKIDIKSKAIECGFVESEYEYYQLLHEVSTHAVKIQLSKYTKESCIIHSIEALDDINENTNHLSERLTEWCGLYFPELDLKGYELMKFILEGDFLYENMELDDLELITSFALSLDGLYENRIKIEKYIVNQMESLAPNLSAVAGALLGARLISIAGSFKRLCFMPSSTIQVLGSNKALFKHLKGKASSPKHGIIFNHPLIKDSNYSNRGKVARKLAAQISIAARVDFYSDKSDALHKD